MLRETLVEAPATWRDGDGPEVDVAVYTAASLQRNVADFPFPAHCTEYERRSVEDRVLSALESAPEIDRDRYVVLDGADEETLRLLAEGQWIPADCLDSEGDSGVLLGRDRRLSVTVNGEDHIRTAVTLAGLQAQEAWGQADGLDDRLGMALDFAYHEEFGYLTASLAHTGSGLEMRGLLHLPGLVMANEIPEQQEAARASRHALENAFGGKRQGRGDLYVLRNVVSLGRSEEELAFRFRHLAQALIERERRARARMVEETPVMVADRVHRALGTAQSARLLDADEALSVISALRWGAASGAISGLSWRALNDLLVLSRPAHIRARLTQDADDLAQSMERAALFRTRCAQADA